MTTTNSYRSQVKKGNKLLLSYQLIYINDRHFSRITQDMQTTTHTVPQNATRITIASANPSEQNPTTIQSHPIRHIDSQRIPISSRFEYYYNTSDQTETDPRNQINISRETNPAPRPPSPKPEGTSYPSITSLRISRTGISPAQRTTPSRIHTVIRAIKRDC